MMAIAMQTKPTMYMFFQLASGPRIMPVKANVPATATICQAAQMPMGAPRFSMGNHMAMTAGAITPIIAGPKPSSRRPMNSATSLGAK